MPKRKGLAAVSPEKRRAIAQKGNAKLRELGKVHRFDSEEGRRHGAKGGRAKAHPEDKILATLRVRPFDTDRLTLKGVEEELQ